MICCPMTGAHISLTWSNAVQIKVTKTNRMRRSIDCDFI